MDLTLVIFLSILGAAPLTFGESVSGKMAWKKFPGSKRIASNSKSSFGGPKHKRDSYAQSQFYSPSYNSNNKDDDFHIPTSTSHNRQRKLAVPKGTEVTLTPAISVPVIPAQGDAPVSFQSSVKMSFPLSMTFNDLSLGFLGEGILEPLFIKRSLWTGTPSGTGLSGTRNNAYFPTVSRKVRDTSSANAGNMTSGRNYYSHWDPIPSRGGCEGRGLMDRKMILQKLELLLSTGFGFPNPRSCLLRAVCELHEVPRLVRGLGLLGEYLMTTLSVKALLKDCSKGNENSPTQDYFLPFAEAESSGKLGRCKAFTKKCHKSLFAI